MELYEDLMSDDWLLGTGVAPAFYESEPVTDDGLIKPCMQISSNSGVDLLSKPYEDEGTSTNDTSYNTSGFVSPTSLGLGVDLDWLDNRIDFSLLDSFELLKEELHEPTPPPVKQHGGQLSEFQTAAIDLLESLMVENNSEPEISFTTLTPRIAPSTQSLEIVGDQSFSDISINVDSGNVSPSSGSMLLSEDIVINPQWDGSCPMTPEEVESLLSSPPLSPDDSLHSYSSDSEWLPYEQPTKPRAKPYARPGEKCEVSTVTPKVKGFDPHIKKERKKVQNKNAATRYRQKKKSEADVTATEFSILDDRNTELKRKVEEMEHEIQYMKGILKDIYKVKGLITD